MLDLKFIRQNSELVKDGSRARGVDVDVDKILLLDKQLLEDKHKLEQLNSERKTLAKGKADPAQGKKIKQQIKKLEVDLKDIQTKLNELLLAIPNLALKDVPVGDESDNRVLKSVGEPTQFSFEPKDYLTIAGEGINIEQAARVAGSRFNYLAGDIAWLQYALVDYVFSILKKHDFIPLITPILLRSEAIRASGKLDAAGDDGIKDMYYLENDDLFLIGTAEQSIGPYHMDQIIDVEKLPLRYFAYTPSFRREAGSYGKDTKGILRVHQFDKIEMYVFTNAEESMAELDKLVNVEEEIVSSLKLPYQVVSLATQDMAFQSAKTIDIEVWVPSQNKYREIMSASTCTDWQARRLNTRYKDPATGKNEFVHTLNATAVAMGRMIIAIIENYQKADGTFTIPKALKKYI
ncbi:MAG: serine--tRNA ligase [Candidatus Buchananbacteria bacterium CG10_big_fil_rev_8_21_14_0_10_42_9]|uniref:Serine--tRNA ligase n=1 Tax=Candidatus Buchananbacteria bacterium CG10_big_fil_rev_8_21_14_0_10_42_9 TaxID=1974526 RepID=A0A2H0W2G4_9BACT|nr:MAG: serine--tRNA ligase [Candidatus Buchananbacteria bacterium CG10_big_fil_rev_8_21_14_0_10_42_9]